MNIAKYLLPAFTLLLNIAASGQDNFISFQKTDNGFAVTAEGVPAQIYISESEPTAVARAANDFAKDIGRIAGQDAVVLSGKDPNADAIIIGTIGMSPLIDDLIKRKIIDVTAIAGKWEGYLIQVIEKPYPNSRRALVIAGNDKRGTTFGIYELSKQIGVSPWYWWADVAPMQHKNIYADAHTLRTEFPAVKYRGIFFNDEEPSLGRFAVEKYGGFTHEFYAKVFELVLRLKGNYVWPAMWWASFNSDDPLNAQLADEYGIVMGTTHHEPMVRAHAEWKTYGKNSEWNYEKNPAVLQKFWTEGIQRMGSHENIVTLAMRGDGDMAMSKGTNIALLEKIVSDQRKIIHDVLQKDVTTVPQVWAIYKEVQDYYDQGMRVPDDVTLLFCDDNWGNIRKLPRIADRPRAGGYGIYYHFDYVGDPRNYKWLNTNPIPKVWEQMHLAYEYGVKEIWIVNVGDLKPLEFPVSFFLDYAWNPDKWNASNLDNYTTQWCTQQFGPTHAEATAKVIEKYTKYNGRRKPELINAETYSLTNYGEAERIVADYRSLEKEAEALYELMPANLKDAFYELVLFPVKACANLNDMYVTAGKNKLYAAQKRVLTNSLSDRTKDLFQKDIDLATYYNKTLANGKWNNMMNQIHIGYTYWQDPKVAVIPETKTIDVPNESIPGVVPEGSEKSLGAGENGMLPDFNAYEKTTRYFDLFNQGKIPFNYSVSADQSFLSFTSTKGTIKDEKRITVSVDWKAVPKGGAKAKIIVTGPRKERIELTAKIINTALPQSGDAAFIETNRVVSIEAEHFDKAVGSANITWQVLPDYGKTLSGITTSPVTAAVQIMNAETPHLEYNMLLTDTTTVSVVLHLGPTLAFNSNEGLRYGISFDDATPQIININKNETPASWSKVVEDNERVVITKHKISKPGRHVLKYWMIDPAIVLQKIIVDARGLKESYLGPPESPRLNATTK